MSQKKQTEITKKKHPIFLKNQPLGEDKFEGGAQSKTAYNIINLIQDNYFNPKVIGIEGDWGAGKSNLIELIKSKLEEKYVVFIFDAWGNQEDLTRKSFLEQLVYQLIKDEHIKNSNKLEEIKEELLAKKSTKNNVTNPKVKPFWVLLTLSFLSYTFLSSIYENLIKEKEIIKDIYFGNFKPLIFLFLIPIVFFTLSFISACKEYILIEKELVKEKKDTSFWKIISYMAYWIQGKETKSTEKETTLEDEPSVYKFREYFKSIEKEVVENKKTLLIVFDNLDRLEKDKIKSLWSSIHTFFSESKDILDSWVIIPYNKKELLIHLNENEKSETGIGFIEKSFPINFRVTPPVVTEWEKFFKEKLNEAFGEIIIEELEKNKLLKIFDNYYTKAIKPRQIVNFINNIVSLYLQWNDEIVNKQIKISHLGIFSLAKDEISEEPIKQILSKEYLKKCNADKIFEFDEDLDKVITALTFGVPLVMADEVLIFKGIKNVISENSQEEMSLYTNHKAFRQFFDRAYYEVEIKEKVNSIPKILVSLKEILEKQEIQGYWQNYSRELLLVETNFENFNQNHKEILRYNENEKQKESIIKKIITNCESSIIDGTYKNENHYYAVLDRIMNFITENELNVIINNLIKPITFSASSFLNVVESQKEKYKNFKINCEEDKILEYHYKNNSTEIDLYKINKNINSLKIIKNNEKYKFNELNSKINQELALVNYDNAELFKQCIDIYEKLNSRPLKLYLNASFYSILNVSRLNENDIFIDAFCIAISDFDKSSQYSYNWNNFPDSLIDKISKRIEIFISYNDILKLLVDNSHARSIIPLKKIAENITKKSYGASRLDLDWALKNYSKIVDFVFDSDIEKEKQLINRINDWARFFKTNPSDIDTKVYSHLAKQELELIKKISDSSLDYFNKLAKEKYLEMFKEVDSKNHIIFKSLFKNNLLDSFNEEFHSAYDDFLKGVSREEINFPVDTNFWDNLLNNLNANKLESYYTSLRDYFINQDEMSDDEIYFFEKGLIKFGNLESNKDGISLKFIMPMIKNEHSFENVFLNNWEKLLSIINTSKHKEAIIGELQTIYNSENHKENVEMILLSNELNLHKKDIELNNSIQS